ncbi:MAG: NAD(P)H-dependent oxidoreductase [Bacteroidia bacterium]|nr:NAD(P)H-dependent oxidoreductase [Bacteroidia bacterium]
MNVMIFNGSMENRDHSIGKIINDFIVEQLEEQNVKTTIFDMSLSNIPMLNPSLIKEIPIEVTQMCNTFQDADLHFWLMPLYHGSIPGVMKNCLDWLEITAKSATPYLTDKIIGTVCWADGSHAVNGIQTMNNIAHSLRAWTIPYSVPLSVRELFQNESKDRLSSNSQEKLKLLVRLALSRKIQTI